MACMSNMVSTENFGRWSDNSQKPLSKERQTAKHVERESVYFVCLLEFVRVKLHVDVFRWYWLEVGLYISVGLVVLVA